MNAANKLQLDLCFSLKCHVLCHVLQPSACPLQRFFYFSIIPVPYLSVCRQTSNQMFPWKPAGLMLLDLSTKSSIGLTGKKQKCASTISPGNCHEFGRESKPTSCMTSKCERKAPSRACWSWQVWTPQIMLVQVIYTVHSSHLGSK